MAAPRRKKTEKEAVPMAKHQSYANRCIALIERDNRAAKVESTLKKALTPLYTVSEVAEYL